MDVKHFDYELPEELIAQTPAECRDRSRLLLIERERGACAEHSFRDLPDLLSPGDLVVLNDSKVFAARLRARRRSGRRIEVLLLGPGPDGVWRGLVRPSKAVRVGEELSLPDGTPFTVLERTPDGISRVLAFPEGVDPFEVAAGIGETPLPPYIRRRPAGDDRNRYQTVYAREKGSAAAPTAGLHFTNEVLGRLKERGISLAFVTLHVGAGTFLPVRSARVERHRMHEEFCTVGPRVMQLIDDTRASGRRVVAAGTTTVRSLETAWRQGSALAGFSGWTDLYIYPPFEFLGVSGLLTNFHLPRSSLLLLVCAFGGRELVLEAYRMAVERRFRFYSYGDVMLII